MARRGEDLKKRTEELKRVLSQPPASRKVILERGTKHTKVIRKSDGMVITTLSETPSDYRSLRNAVSKLRKSHVFKAAPPELQLASILMPWEDREDGMVILQRLGWEPGQMGRGGGPLRRFGEMMQEATLEAGVDVEPLAKDAYTQAIRQGIIRGEKIQATSVDKLILGIEYVQQKLGPEPVPEKIGLQKLEDWALDVETAEEPEEFAEVGPLYNGDAHVEEDKEQKVEHPLIGQQLDQVDAVINNHVTSDSLHLRVLVALIRPETLTLQQKIALAAEVAGAEGL